MVHASLTGGVPVRLNRRWRAAIRFRGKGDAGRPGTRQPDKRSRPTVRFEGCSFGRTSTFKRMNVAECDRYRSDRLSSQRRTFELVNPFGLLMAKELQIRFAIGSSQGPQSSVWRVFSHRDEVYVAHRTHAHVEKFSFHSSGICRRAFTRQFGVPSGLSDRATQKWWRMPTPERGLEQASCVLRAAFPTDYLSDPKELTSKAVTFIPAAPVGMAMIVEMFFTNETTETVRRKLARCNEMNLIASHSLENGELFTIASYTIDWKNRDIIVPSSHHEKADLVFSQHDPANTGRPLRLTMYNNPQDCDAIMIQELGGYRADDRLKMRLPEMDTFTRDIIYASSRDQSDDK